MKKGIALFLGLLLPMIVFASAKTVPYTSALNGDSDWIVVDNNNDGVTWEDLYTDKVYSASDDTSIAADDWLISPSIHLEAGKKYQLSFRYYTFFLQNKERFKVMLGQGATVEALSKGRKLHDTGSDGVESSSGYTTVNAYITVDTDGDYNIGICCYSEAGQHWLHLNNFSLTYFDEDNIPAQILPWTSDFSTKENFEFFWLSDHGLSSAYSTKTWVWEEDSINGNHAQFSGSQAEGEVNEFLMTPEIYFDKPGVYKLKVKSSRAFMAYYIGQGTSFKDFTNVIDHKGYADYNTGGEYTFTVRKAGNYRIAANNWTLGDTYGPFSHSIYSMSVEYVSELTPKTPPYSSGLYADSSWFVVDGNYDGVTWKPYAPVNTSNMESMSWNVEVRNYKHFAQTADEYLISPAIHLESDRTYIMSFELLFGGWYKQAFKALMGTSYDVDDLNNGTVLFDTGIFDIGDEDKYTFGTWTTNKFMISPAEDSDYYFGLNCYSQNDEKVAYVRNFKIEEYVEIPSAPTDLVGTVTNERNVVLSWTLPTTNSAGVELYGTLKGIEVYRDDVLVTTLAGTATSWIDSPSTGLVGDSDHVYKLKAVMASGTSEFSDSVTVTVSRALLALPYASDFSTQEKFDAQWVAKCIDNLKECTTGWKYDADEQCAKLDVLANAKTGEALRLYEVRFPAKGKYRMKVEIKNDNGNYATMRYVLYGVEDDYYYSDTYAKFKETEITSEKAEYVYDFEVPAGNYFLYVIYNEDNSESDLTDTFSLYSVRISDIPTKPASGLSATVTGPQVNLTWTNPSEDVLGNTLTSLQAVEVYRDGVLMANLIDTAPGDTITWADEEPNKGANTYWVIPYNEYGAVNNDDPTEVIVNFDNIKTIPYTADFTNWMNLSDGTTAWTTFSDGTNEGYGVTCYTNTSKGADATVKSERILFEPKHIYVIGFDAELTDVNLPYDLSITAGPKASSQEVLRSVRINNINDGTKHYQFTARAVDDKEDDDADGYDTMIEDGLQVITLMASAQGRLSISNFTIIEDETSSVDDLGQRATYRIEGDRLLFSAVASRIAIVDLSGKTVVSTSNADSIGLGSLSSGVYIFNATVNGQRLIGKFVK